MSIGCWRHSCRWIRHSFSQRRAEIDAKKGIPCHRLYQPEPFPRLFLYPKDIPSWVRTPDSSSFSLVFWKLIARGLSIEPFGLRFKCYFCSVPITRKSAGHVQKSFWKYLSSGEEGYVVTGYRRYSRNHSGRGQGNCSTRSGSLPFDVRPRGIPLHSSPPLCCV